MSEVNLPWVLKLQAFFFFLNLQSSNHVTYPLIILSLKSLYSGYKPLFYSYLSLLS